jgi:hypothetical protein
MQPAALGLTVTTGRATVAVLRGTRAAPEMVARFEVQLSDRWQAESSHPYHQELGRPRSEGEPARVRSCRAAEAGVRRAIRLLLDDMKELELAPHGAGIVATRPIDPARVRGAHARAHAAERELYLDAVVAALGESGVPTVVAPEKRIRAEAAARLRLRAPQLDAVLKQFVRRVGTPWRAPEKHAALAAWMCLPESDSR